MDVIERIAAGHRDIAESSDLSHKLFSLIDNDAFFWDKAEKVSAFFDREVREHFTLEQKVLFPVLAKRFPGGQEIVRALLTEHEEVLALLERFSVIARHHLSYPSRVTREHLVAACRDIFEKLVPHAKKEDETVFSRMRDCFSDEDYHRLAALYEASRHS